MNDLAASAVKAAPPISATVATLLGYGMQDWLVIITIIYTILQTVFLIYEKAFKK
jgi:disulfide bond formation protein DsbB